MKIGTKCILYVDDEQFLLDLVQFSLEKTGIYSVKTSTSAVDALAYLNDHPVDAIISDYQMPGMDGIAFLKALRTQGNRTPFIIFTGKGREEVVIEALNNGADFYLQKGGEPKSQFAEMVHKVSKAIEARQFEAALVNSQKRTAEIIEFLPDATFAIDTDGVVIAWNHAMEVMTGVKKHDMLKKGNYEYAIPIYREHRPILIDLVLHYDEAVAKSYPFVTREGDKFISELFVPHLNEGRGAYIWFIASPLYDAAGSVTGAIESIRDITKRKLAEEGLRTARDEYMSLLSHMTDVYYRSDARGRLILASRSLAKHLGYDDLSECLGQPIADTFYTDPAERKRFLEEILRKGSVSDFEVILKKKDGTPVRVATSSYVCYDESGAVRGIEGTWRDITERKRVEEALRESERKFRSVVENIPDLIWTTAEDGRTVYVSPAVAQVYGFSPDEIYQGGDALFFGRIHPEDREYAKSSFMALFTEQKVFDIEYRIERKDGQWIWLHDRAVSIYTREGISYADGIASDITARKQAEAALMESEERYRRLADHSPDGIYRISLRDGMYEYASPAMQQISGYTPEEHYANPLLIRKVIHPDWAPYFEREWKNVQAGIVPPTFEYQIIDKKGDVHWINQRNMLVRDEKGTPVALEGIITDITERKRAEMALVINNERLQMAQEIGQIGSWEFDTRTGMLWASEEAYRIFAVPRPPDGLIPLDEVGRMIPERERVRRALVDLIETGAEYNIEYIVEPADHAGQKIIHSMARILYDADNRPVRIAGVLQDVTDRRRMDQTLWESQERLSLAVESANIGLWDLRFDTGEVLHNRQWTEMLGYSCDEIPRPSGWWQERLHPDDAPLVVRTSEDHISGKVPDFDVVYRMQHKDGSWRWLHSKGRLVSRDPAGRALRMIGINQDVTVQKQTEAALRESEERYRHFFSTSRDSIFIITEDGKSIDFNEAALDTFGYRTREELAAVPITDLYDDAGDRNEIIASIRKNGFVEEYPVRMRRQDRTVIETLITSVPLLDGEGRIQAFFSIIRDVTGKKRADEEIRALQQFQESIIENAHIWISVLDAKGTVSVWNKAAEEISGYRASEVIGTHTIWRRLYPDAEYRRTVTARITEVLASKTYLENFETRIRTKSGQERIIWWNTRSLEDVSGVRESFIAIGKDVTVQQHAEEALRQVIAKQNILSGITRHDIGNKLIALHGYLELIRSDDTDQVFSRHTDRMEQVLAALTDQISFTRVYQELGISDPVWIDAREVIEQSLSQFNLGIIQVDNCISGLAVYADPMLARVFSNLVENTLWHGKTTTKIRCSSAMDGDAMIIIVEDDGVGIPAGNKEMIFERGVGSHTGLGLFLSREILAITGLSIHETGKPGSGARFEIVVPVGKFRVQKTPVSSDPAVRRSP